MEQEEIREIYLKDLILYCLKKWRLLLIFMLLSALAMGVYNYQAEIKNNEIKQQKLMEKSETDTESEEMEELIDPLSSAIKYSTIGVILGAFVFFLICVLIYISTDRLQCIKNFKKEFGMPLLGTIRSNKCKKSIFGKVDTWLLRLEEGPYAKISYKEQIKIAAANVEACATKIFEIKRSDESYFDENLSEKNALNEDFIERKVPDKNSRAMKRNIMIAGTLEKKEIASEYSNLISEIEGITCSEYRQLAFQASALRELKNYDGILFIEKKGVSYSEFIRQEKDMAFDREVEVLGCIVF